jgi:ABC-type transport system involved in multi-copper enzyme maturation permease subunit
MSDLVVCLFYLDFSHRLWGKVIFLSALATILMGSSEIGALFAFFVDKDAKYTSRLIIIFFGLLCAGFSFVVIYLLGKAEFQRPSDANDDRSAILD